MSASIVYFIRPVGERGPVKIGFSRVPGDRLRAQMAWSPVLLEIAAKIHGAREIEARFHTLFNRDHLHGEWFRASARMDSVISAINGGSFDVSALPTPDLRLVAISSLGRENKGLRVAVSHKLKGADGQMPPHVRELYDALSVAGPERDLAVETLHRLLREAA